MKLNELGELIGAALSPREAQQQTNCSIQLRGSSSLLACCRAAAAAHNQQSKRANPAISFHNCFIAAFPWAAEGRNQPQQFNLPIRKRRLRLLLVWLMAGCISPLQKRNQPNNSINSVNFIHSIDSIIFLIFFLASVDILTVIILF